VSNAGPKPPHRLRFLCDTGLSGGAWLHIAPARGGRSGYQTVSPGARVSTCDLEVVAPWTALDCLTPDATQLADEAWQPEVGAAACLSRRERLRTLLGAAGGDVVA
jgi:hypothetical protein